MASAFASGGHRECLCLLVIDADASMKQSCHRLMMVVMTNHGHDGTLLRARAWGRDRGGTSFLIRFPATFGIDRKKITRLL